MEPYSRNKIYPPINEIIEKLLCSPNSFKINKKKWYQFSFRDYEIVDMDTGLRMDFDICDCHIVEVVRVCVTSKPNFILTDAEYDKLRSRIYAIYSMRREETRKRKFDQLIRSQLNDRNYWSKQYLK